MIQHPLNLAIAVSNRQYAWTLLKAAQQMPILVLLLWS